jgi:hypothetical protein
MTFLAMWAFILIAAVIQDLVIVAGEARKAGVDIAGRPAKIGAYALTPGILIALVITLKILMDLQAGESSHLIRYIPPVWMMGYGVGVFAAGLFSVRLPRLLGMGFIVLGALNLLVISKYGVIMTGLSFGGLHILFGMIVIRKMIRGRE